ncbi:hypothetical protein PROFUN_11455 [Planoprotostelium fungivorum]|uniref:Uncharacterized protein n=1 Tax=Planoprotostelium fungivorum TaxID=1890364 RepID=A0A2P6N4V6_9EUKA|nr:hypothetical protein PROFUN_11455 [Planoprotostelium fungivorum]
MIIQGSTNLNSSPHWGNTFHETQKGSSRGRRWGQMGSTVISTMQSDHEHKLGLIPQLLSYRS